MAKKAKVYAVARGLQTGIFYTWRECEAVVKGYPGAVYKGFGTEAEAKVYLHEKETEKCLHGDETGKRLNGEKTGQYLHEEETEQRLHGDETGQYLHEEEMEQRLHGDETGQYLHEEETEQRLHGDEKAISAQRTAGSLSAVPEFPKASDTLTAYVDGSYHDGFRVYAFGCVFLFSDGRVLTYFGNGREPDSLAMRNVAGEMIGAMYAVQFALRNQFKHLDICYDYAGIEKWATGEWKTNKDLTRKYAAFMRKQGCFIDIRYHKVEAHANITYNEMADQAAKRGLTEGNGIPEIDSVILEK